jgi:hypothetical protein
MMRSSRQSPTLSFPNPNESSLWGFDIAGASNEIIWQSEAWNPLLTTGFDAEALKQMQPLTEFRQDTSLSVDRWVKYVSGSFEPKFFFAPDPSSDVTQADEPSIDDMFEPISADGIAISSRMEVLSYLLEYPDMITLLPRICSQVVDTLGPNAQYLLQVHDDPDIGYRFLELLVRKKQYQGVMKTIDEIQSAYNSEFNRSNGWLVITTDFVLP